jgi:hypothetical protein
LIFPSISEALLFRFLACHFKRADVSVPATSLICIFFVSEPPFLGSQQLSSLAVDALALFALSRSQKPANVSFSNSVHVFTGITFSFSSSIFFALYHRLLVCGSLTFNVYAHCILSQPRQLLRDSVVVPSHRQRAPTA